MSRFGAPYIAKQGFETQTDPEYQPGNDFHQLCLDQQHEAKLESLLGSPKPVHPLRPQVLVTSIKSNGQSNIAKVRSNLHIQLKDELNEAYSLNTFNVLDAEEQKLASRLKKMDEEEFEIFFGEKEVLVRIVLDILIEARQIKASEALLDVTDD